MYSDLDKLKCLDHNSSLAGILCLVLFCWAAGLALLAIIMKIKGKWENYILNVPKLNPGHRNALERYFKINKR